MADSSSAAVSRTRSHLEELLELEQLGEDLFKSGNRLWHPPGGRGLYGGVIMSQSLAAAQRTVGDDFACHSLQSQFLLSGTADMPVTYSVERLRGGRSFVARSVQAFQDGRCLCTVLMSFSRKKLSKPSTSSSKQVRHALTPAQVKVPDSRRTRNVNETATAGFGPLTLPVSLNGSITSPQDRVLRCWIRSPEPISRAQDMTTHQAILVYLSDWLALSVTAYVHGHFSFPESITSSYYTSPMADTALGMLSTLTHAVYFHSSSSIRADEWMLLEASSPWAGDERCLVNGRVFSQDGTLLASYTQEGVIRLRQDAKKRSANL